MAQKYRFKTKPYKHQLSAVKNLLDRGWGGALLMEPRTGKTKTTIDWLSALATRGDIDRVVVICPNRVMGVWVNEFNLHAPISVNVTVWDSNARKTTKLQPVSGMYDLEVVIVNFEAFATPGKKTPSGRQSKTSGRFKFRKDLRKWIDGKPCAGVVDESHKIKSPSGRTSNMVVSMREDFSHRVILTGTPLTKAKRSHDVYMQWQFLNPDRFSDFPGVGDFKEYFGKWVRVEANGRAFPKYKGPRNVKELQSRMAKDSVIVRREDCFDLPPREDIVKFVHLKNSDGVYQQMADDMVAELESGSIAEASIKLVQSLRLSQVTSGFITTEEGDVERFGFEKADELTKILEDEFEKEESVVVAARWKADLDLIESLAEDIGYKVYSIRGGMKREETDRAIASFRKNVDTPAVMVIQPQAASMGIDLSRASTMIWYSHTSSWVDFTQACDRIALSRNSTTFIHLVAEKTIDEALLETLRTDTDMSKALMNNPRAMLTERSLNVDRAGKIEVKEGTT